MKYYAKIGHTEIVAEAVNKQEAIKLIEYMISFPKYKDERIKIKELGR